MVAPPGSPAPLPPWLAGGGRSSARGGATLRSLRGPALLVAGGVIGWLLHTWSHPAAPPVEPIAPLAAAPVCPAPAPCTSPATGPAAAPRGHPHAKTVARAPTLQPLPAEGPATEETRREALRAFAQHKAGDLRGCLGDPGRGPLRRVGAALEIDAHGAVAAVQILGGDTGSRELESCYSARLRAWRFPQALLQGDERLLVNFVL